MEVENLEGFNAVGAVLFVPEEEVSRTLAAPGDVRAAQVVILESEQDADIS